MSTDLTLSFSVDQTPQEVFDAVNNVRGWWSGSIVGDTATLGGTWVYTVPDIHFSKMRTSELVPGERVAWQVLDSYLSFTADKEEWTGTTVRFDIGQPDGPSGRTLITFTHLGVDREQECFDVCQTAWGQYVLGSLRDLVQSGAGRPGSFGSQESLDAALAGTVEAPMVS